LMCSEQPSLQEGRPPVYQGQKVLFNISRLTNNGVPESFLGYLPISSPTIRAHQATGLHTLFDGHYQVGRRGVKNAAKTYAPDLFPFIFNGNKYQRFSGSASPSFSRSFAANISFVHLYSPGKSFSSRSHHGNTEFMKPDPYGFVPGKPQDSLQSLGTNPVFLSNYIPDSPEP